MSHATEFDEYGHKGHGHVIVSLFTLRFVLIALLICTLLTSGAAWAESAIASAFHVEIPQWINACVALSIAVVKTALVVMFFMQLKYDNPMNTIIFVFTILTVFSFLGFTSLDLGNRDTIDRFKNQYAYDGGNGLDGTGIPITARARDAENQAKNDEADPHAAKKAKELEESKEEEESFDERRASEAQIVADAGYLRREPKLGSSSNRSRPVEGVTIPGLPGYHAPVKAGESHVAPPSSGGERPAEPTSNTEIRPEKDVPNAAPRKDEGSAHPKDPNSAEPGKAPR